MEARRAGGRPVRAVAAEVEEHVVSRLRALRQEPEALEDTLPRRRVARGANVGGAVGHEADLWGPEGRSLGRVVAARSGGQTLGRRSFCFLVRRCQPRRFKLLSLHTSWLGQTLRHCACGSTVEQENTHTGTMRTMQCCVSAACACLRHRCRRSGNCSDRSPPFAPPGDGLCARVLCSVMPARVHVAGVRARARATSEGAAVGKVGPAGAASRKSRPCHEKRRAARLYKFLVRSKCALHVKTWDSTFRAWWPHLPPFACAYGRRTQRLPPRSGAAIFSCLHARSPSGGFNVVADVKCPQTMLYVEGMYRQPAGERASRQRNHADT